MKLTTQRPAGSCLQVAPAKGARPSFAPQLDEMTEETYSSTAAQYGTTVAPAHIHITPLRTARPVNTMRDEAKTGECSTASVLHGSRWYAYHWRELVVTRGRRLCPSRNSPSHGGSAAHHPIADGRNDAINIVKSTVTRRDLQSFGLIVRFVHAQDSWTLL